MDKQFDNQKYVSLETYRRNGVPVRTPVWFAEHNGVLYIYSLASAGKVKRIRNNPRVRIAPCDMRGKVKGNWVEGKARILDSSGEELGHRLLNEKYGWVKRTGDMLSKLRGRTRAVIEIRV